MYETFRPRILRYLVRLVGEGDAEDLAQEVFARVSQALETFRGESQLSTWLYRIATNAALDRLRSPSFRRAARQRSLEDAVESDPGGGAAQGDWARTPAPSVEQQLVRREMDECLRGYIEQLPENYRTVLVLSDLEGFKDGEIAEILGVTLGTVKIRLHRARARLKQDLEATCDPCWIEENEFLPDLKRFLGSPGK